MMGHIALWATLCGSPFIAEIAEVAEGTERNVEGVSRKVCWPDAPKAQRGGEFNAEAQRRRGN